MALPTDFSDALAQARGLGVGFTVAHQYRSQLSPQIKSAIDTNCRNKIIFGLNSADAKDMSAMANELETQDFMELPRYQIYANLQNNGKSTNWISGKTLPPSRPLRLPLKLKATSMANYGQETADFEPTITPAELTQIGRKKIIK
ncbi:MAG: hypothetical protein LBC86_09270 [Oscillospiraceae bacterium]|nr:hypothetical protein [Oscillospiraceae bacterium]